MTLECYMRVLAGREKLEGHSRVEVSRPSEIWRWLTESDTSTQSSENGINEHWNSMGDPSHIRYVKGYLLHAKRGGHMCLRTHKRHPRLCPISIPFTISPLTLELLPLPRLTPIRSSTFLLLVSTHTCAQSYVHSWRGLKSKPLATLTRSSLLTSNIERRL
jgi:hypothetical protein